MENPLTIFHHFQPLRSTIIGEPPVKIKSKSLLLFVFFPGPFFRLARASGNKKPRRFSDAVLVYFWDHRSLFFSVLLFRKASRVLCSSCRALDTLSWVRRIRSST